MKQKRDVEVRLTDGTVTTLAEIGEKLLKDQDDQLKAISEHLPEHPAPGEIFEIEGHRYSLVRERDGAGDSGPMLMPFDWSKRAEVGKNGTIQIGLGVKCGSIYGRTFSNQDWWLTTPVTEIIEQGKDKDGSWVKFRTGNSVYTVRGF